MRPMRAQGALNGNRGGPPAPWSGASGVVAVTGARKPYTDRESGPRVCDLRASVVPSGTCGYLMTAIVLRSSSAQGVAPGGLPP